MLIVYLSESFLVLFEIVRVLLMTRQSWINAGFKSQLVWYGVFMHFCDSNHEITRMQQEEIQQHQRSLVDYIVMKT